MTAETSSAVQFIGWFRPPGGRWRKVVEAPDHDTALAGLLESAKGSGDLTVLPAGQDPNRRPTRRVRVEGDQLSFLNAGEQ